MQTDKTKTNHDNDEIADASVSRIMSYYFNTTDLASSLTIGLL